MRLVPRSRRLARRSSPAARLRAPADRGQSLVEFSLVMVPLFIIMLAIVQFGFIFNSYVTITNASREGARLGTVYVYDSGLSKAQNDLARNNAIKDSVLASMNLLNKTAPNFATSGTWTQSGLTFTNGDLVVKNVGKDAEPLLRLGVGQRDFQGFGDLVRDFVLDIEDVLDQPVESVRPQVIAITGADQLRRDPYAATRLPHAAFEDVVDAQRISDLPDVDLLVPELKHVRARQQAKFGDLRQVGDDVFGDSCAEIIALAIGTHVL